MQQGKEAVGYVHHESGRPETTDEANYKEAGRVSSHSPSSSVLFHPQSHRSTPAFWGEGSIAQPEISLRLFVSFAFFPFLERLPPSHDFCVIPVLRYLQSQQ